MKKKLFAVIVYAFAFAICMVPLTLPQNSTNNIVVESSHGVISSNIDRIADIGTKSKQSTEANSYLGSDSYVTIGGTPIGIVIGAKGIIVIGSSEVKTTDGPVSPLAGVDIVKGDIVVAVNDLPITNLYELRQILENTKGAVIITVDRNGNKLKRAVTPVVDIFTGTKRIGLLANEDIGGVGTLTFVTKSGKFAALGHHIVDPESGLGQELNTGQIFPVQIDGVVKSEKGKAGGLTAKLNRLITPLGSIDKNTNIGLYGTFSANPSGQIIRIAEAGEVKMGRAQVLTTISGSQPKFYECDIVKVVSQSDTEEKGLVIAIRDKELLEKAGGIVQGMSGSPIVQNGALVGAVTHVFVSDPTRGYAVHSRFMLQMLDYPMKMAS